ncbi:MAG: hypothetical protein OHK0015_15050 [Chloroflexi bacterium OHK40]
MQLQVISNRATDQDAYVPPRKSWRRLLRRMLVLFALLAVPFGGATVLAASAGAAVGTFSYTPNLHPLGFSDRVVPLDNNVPGQSIINSDLAFWGRLAFQGTYDGFRIIDISSPSNPFEIINYTGCSGGTTVGNQGDVLVWQNLLIRSWNSPVSAGSAATASCGGQLVGQGFEGLSIFDISNPASPVLIKNLRMASDTVPTGCGSHTATLVPDVARGNVYVYNSGSSGACPGIDIVKIPLGNPASAAFLRREPAGRSCHDTGVILGEVNLISCAGGNGFTVWSFDPSIDAPAVGSIEDPVQLYSRSITGVTIGHSAAFTWDGEVLIFGHEPGGGTQARCQASSSLVDRTLFFFEARTGALLGQFVQPRPQTSLENCTWHNYNVVPTDKRYVLVSGNYQMGISVIEFTNPANAYEVAYADPAPLVNPNNPAAIETGGDWSTYWYNGRIYESDITRGLIIWNLSSNITAGSYTFDHLNPQTQETSFPFKGTAFGRNRAADQQGMAIFGESAADDVSGGTGSDEGFSGDGDGYASE